VKDVKPSPEGESVKVKVKVRVNLHGILTISSASLVLKQDASEQDTNEQGSVGPEAMETEAQRNEVNGSANQQQAQTENAQANHIGNEVRNMFVYILALRWGICYMSQCTRTHRWVQLM
jgi:hypothetical protein